MDLPAWSPHWWILFSLYERSPGEWKDSEKEKYIFLLYSFHLFILINVDKLSGLGDMFIFCCSVMRDSILDIVMSRYNIGMTRHESEQRKALK